MRLYIVFALFLSLLGVNAQAACVNLGTAASFGLLGGSAVTNAVPGTVILGDVGVAPGSSITGFPPGVITGTTHITDAVAGQAQSDLTAAYLSAAGAPCPPTHNLNVDLGTFNAGNPLLPGVYCFSSSAGLTGNLTLDAQGDPSACWIFQIGSSLTTATGATVTLINGANPCNVFWQVGSSATIQTGNTFTGTIMALTSITLDGGILNGRALARNGAVTISGSEFVNTVCAPILPCVHIAKKTDRDTAAVGDSVTYTFTVCNCGTTIVTVDSVIDSNPMVGDLTSNFTAANGNSSTLAPGICVEFSKAYTVQAADQPALTNTVTVTAQDSTGTPATSSDQATVTVTPTPPTACVHITKVGNRITASVGDQIDYTFTVCNCGTGDLTVDSVPDSLLGDMIADFTAANGGSSTLAAGTCVTFVKSYMVKATDPNPLTNSVTVNAPPVSSTDQWSVTILPGPCVSVVKLADRTAASAGDQINYTFTVCNCGAADLTVDSVIDSRLGDMIADFTAANGGSSILAAGACVMFVKSYTVLTSDTSPLTNTVIVTAHNDGTVVTGNSQASVTISARRCFLPVTLTQQDWHNFCASAPGVPGGLVYNLFPTAFAKYRFFGSFYVNQVIIGAPRNVITAGSHSITFIGKTSGLSQLCNFLPQLGPCDRLWGSFTNPSYLLTKNGVKTSNVLAGEVLALTLNIAYNDMRLMPRSKGYDLEKFTLTQGIFKGKTVGQVLNIGNAVLAGTPPCSFGLTGTFAQGCAALVNILQNINANYEFVDINTFIDRGYLKPNVPLGQPGAPHPIIVSF